MAPKFLERNKKKGLLAALLLFLNRRKAVSLLLLVVVLASTIVAGPSFLRIDLMRVESLARRAGVDTSGWGQDGKKSFRDLIEAFRAAKTSGSSGSSLGTAMGRAPQSGQTSSLDMVKGSRSDLGAPVANMAKPGSVKGVMTPEDAKSGGRAVEIAQGDLGGERQGMLEGLMKGLFGAGAGAAGGELSGGAYASKNFFSGSAGAGGHADDQTKAALSSVGKVDAPQTSRASVAAGKASAKRGHSGRGRMLTGGPPGGGIGSRTPLVQLAEAKAQEVLLTDTCGSSDCPNEQANVINAAVFDGLTGQGGGGTSPAASPNGPSSQGAAKLYECTKKMMECQKEKKPDLDRYKVLMDELAGYVERLPGSCNNDCNCNPCTDVKNHIYAICAGELQVVLRAIVKACDIPAHCADLGITDPTTSAAGAANAFCTLDTKCGCNSKDGRFSQFKCKLDCCGRKMKASCILLTVDPFAGMVLTPDLYK